MHIIDWPVALRMGMTTAILQDNELTILTRCDALLHFYNSDDNFTPVKM